MAVGLHNKARLYDSLLKALGDEVEWLRTPGNIISEHAMADRLQALLDQHQGGSDGSQRVVFP